MALLARLLFWIEMGFSGICPSESRISLRCKSNSVRGVGDAPLLCRLRSEYDMSSGWRSTTASTDSASTCSSYKHLLIIYSVLTYCLAYWTKYNNMPINKQENIAYIYLYQVIKYVSWCQLRTEFQNCSQT